MEETDYESAIGYNPEKFPCNSCKKLRMVLSLAVHP